MNEIMPKPQRNGEVFNASVPGHFPPFRVSESFFGTLKSEEATARAAMSFS